MQSLTLRAMLQERLHNYADAHAQYVEVWKSLIMPHLSLATRPEDTNDRDERLQSACNARVASVVNGLSVVVVLHDYSKHLHSGDCFHNWKVSNNGEARKLCWVPGNVSTRVHSQ